MFGKFKENEGKIQENEDFLGGFNNVLESDIYTGVVDALYVTHTANGAMAINLVAKFDGTEYRETFYVTNREGDNFYVNKKTNEKHYLPGYVVIDDLCVVTTNKRLSSQETEKKVVEIYNFDTKENEPTPVPMLMDVVGKPFSAAILKKIVDKQKRGDDGNYYNTGETREVNEIVKILHPEFKLTVPEARKNIEEPKYWPGWLAKFQGKTINRATGAAGGDKGKPAFMRKSNTSSGGGTTAGGKPSLFGKK